MADIEMMRRTQAQGHIKTRSRLANLAAPKQSKASWWTSFETRLVWGNQEPMWPVRPETLKAVASPRVETLAVPKKDHSIPNTFISPEFQYSCGRSSQIWTVSPQALYCMHSQRVGELARHKTAPPQFIRHRDQHQYSCGRSSTIWQTKKRASTVPASAHTTALAQPKKTHPDYVPNREQVQSVVSEGAKSYMATERIENLAKPKVRLDGPFRDPQWQVSDPAREAIPTDRVLELAKAKKLAEGYRTCRGVIWRPSPGAMNAVASNRMEELAKPIVRDTMDHVQFDPSAFSVSEAAKKAKASARIEELAQPITR